MLLMSCFKDYAFFSFFLNVIGRMFFTGFLLGNIVNLVLNFLYFMFSTTFVILKPDSINRIFISVFFYISVTVYMFLLIIS